MFRYFSSVRNEVKKVVWPTKEELKKYTAIVFGTCIFFSVLFWGMDTGVIAGLQKLISLK